MVAELKALSLVKCHGGNIASDASGVQTASSASAAADGSDPSAAAAAAATVVESQSGRVKYARGAANVMRAAETGGDMDVTKILHCAEFVCVHR